MKNRYYFLSIVCFAGTLFWGACGSDTVVKKSVEVPSVSVTEKKEKIIPAPAKKETIPSPDYDTSKWADVHLLDQSVLLDIRYATDNNFVEEQLYDCGRCFLRPAVAKAMLAAHHELQEQGLGLKMFDCYRPRPIQQKLWDKVPNASYVTPPSRGSMHNRGLAIDVTIVDQSGKELEMGTTYDFFGKRAHHTFTDLPETVLANRKMLKELMYKHGFLHIRTEWWHYSYTIGKYELSDMLWKCDDHETKN